MPGDAPVHAAHNADSGTRTNLSPNGTICGAQVEHNAGQKPLAELRLEAPQRREVGRTHGGARLDLHRGHCAVGVFEESRPPRACGVRR